MTSYSTTSKIETDKRPPRSWSIGADAACTCKQGVLVRLMLWRFGLGPNRFRLTPLKPHPESPPRWNAPYLKDFLLIIPFSAIVSFFSIEDIEIYPYGATRQRILEDSQVLDTRCRKLTLAQTISISCHRSPFYAPYRSL